MINLSVLVIAAIIALGSNLNAAGFRLSEQDAKATGMGNSFVAVADDASAVWYNPAAMTDLEGTNLSLGTVMVAPSMEHKNANGTTDEIKNKLNIPPHFYATRKFSDKWSLGLGVNYPFGLSTDWDRTANTSAVATLSEIKVLNYNLSGAYRATEKISVAAGLSYATLDATMNNWLGGKALELEGDGTGVGYNAALFYKHNNKLDFGLNYHSRIKFDIDGTAKYGTTVSNNATTKITTPDLIQAGASYKYSDKWMFSAEADYTAWSTYDTLVVKSNTYAALGLSTTQNQIKDWQNVWAFRLGSEYKCSDTWKLRGGAFYDFNPVKEKYFDTRVPDADRVALSVGAGWTKGSITVDASYMYLMFLERTIDSSIQDDALGNVLNGKYNSSAQLPALTVSYKF